MNNKIVARFTDGRTLKGSTSDFVPAKPVSGKKITVVFADGETLVGTTQGYQPGRPGFFMVSADPDSNTERCYVVAVATRAITLT